VLFHLVAAVSTLAFAQTQERVTFEAASIRRSDPLKAESYWRVSPGRLTVQNMSLKGLITAAYRVKRYQVTGGPKWFDEDRFDVTAKLAAAPAGVDATGSEGAARLMTAAQSLLQDRFRLTFHQESKSVSGYVLVVAKSGPKLTRAQGDGSSNIRSGRGTLQATGFSMERFASSLSALLEAPVVDETGLAGTYDLSLEYTPDGSSETTTGPVHPTLYTALQETLGLKLEARKVPVPIFVVDGAEKPGEN